MKLRRLTKQFTVVPFIVTFLTSSSLAIASPVASPQKNNALTFWTAERINKAIAFDMVFDKGSKVGYRVPTAKVVAQPGGGGTTTSVLGASWNNGGLPLTASGKVFFAIGNSYYQCSGALIKDGKTDRSIVLTAGHCVYDNASKSYVTNWIFIPSYDVNQVSILGCTTSSGCWPAKEIFAHSGFTTETSFTSTATLYDWGFAKITFFNNGKLPDGGDVSAEGTNSFPYSFNGLALQTLVSSFGYPASGKYSGKDLVYSSGKLAFDSSNSNNTYSLASDMTGGCSGGPWLSDMATASPYSGTLSSVNSYKYGTTKFIYGPKFNSNTLETFNLALS